LGRIASEPGLRDALVAKGQRQLAKFSWQRCAEQTLDVYRSAMSPLQ
jgi:hypothetical protein